jgi:hypothetical protein
MAQNDGSVWASANEHVSHNAQRSTPVGHPRGAGGGRGDDRGLRVLAAPSGGKCSSHGRWCRPLVANTVAMESTETERG